MELGFWLIHRLFFTTNTSTISISSSSIVPILASSSIHWIKWLNQHIMVSFQIQTQKGKKREARGEYTETSLVWKKIYISWSRYSLTFWEYKRQTKSPSSVWIYTSPSLNKFEQVLNESWTSLNMFGNSFNNFEWLF